MEDGTRYVGVDLSEELLDRGRTSFAGREEQATLVHADARLYRAPVKCDLAICQALLMHCEDPMAVLENMKENAREGGYLVCIEPNWNAAMAATHISGRKSTEFTDLGILQRLFENDYANTGKDGNIGIKVPLYMEQLGLKEIQCRKNDKVAFVSPRMDPDAKNVVLEAFRENGFGRTIDDERSFKDDLRRRGLSRREAARELGLEITLNSSFNRMRDNMYFSFSPNMFLSSGRVPFRGD
jgi:SAM-dependent methyltransferase